MLTAVIVVFSLPLLFLLYRFKSTHIGYGWVLEFNDKKRPEIVIVARLLKSPVADAGIPNGAILLERDGVKLDFKSNEEAQKWADSLPKPRKGLSTTCLIRDNKGKRVITLSPRRVRKKVPTYGYVNLDSAPRFVGGYMINYGMRVCRLTGQIHQTRYLVNM